MDAFGIGIRNPAMREIVQDACPPSFERPVQFLPTDPRIELQASEQVVIPSCGLLGILQTIHCPHDLFHPPEFGNSRMPLEDQIKLSALLIVQIFFVLFKELFWELMYMLRIQAS